MNDIIDFQNSNFFFFAKVKPKYDIYEFFKCYTASQMAINMIKSDGIQFVPVFVILISIVLTGIIIRNLLYKWINYNFKKYFSLIVVLITIAFSFIGISTFVYVFTMISSFFVKLDSISTIYRKYQETAYKVYNFFEDADLNKNFGLYTRLIQQFTQFCTVSGDMVKPMISSDFLNYLNDVLKLGLKAFFTDLGKTLTSMTAKGEDMSQLATELMKFISENYDKYLSMFTHKITEYGSVFTYFDDILMYSRNLAMVFVLNMAIIQYGIPLLMSIYFILRIKFSWKISFKFISTVHLILSFVMLYAKYMIYLRLMWACYFIRDITDDLEPIKFYYFRGEYFTDSKSCFAQWSTFGQAKNDTAYHVIMEIAHTCIFKKDSNLMNAFYGDLRLHGKDILDYIERGYDVFTRMRSLLSIWQSRIRQPDVDPNGVVRTFMGPFVSDLIRLYDDLSKDWGGKNGLVKEIKNAESCDFAYELYVYFLDIACKGIPNLVFYLILYDIGLLFCFWLIPLSF